MGEEEVGVRVRDVQLVLLFFEARAPSSQDLPQACPRAEHLWWSHKELSRRYGNSRMRLLELAATP